MLVTLGGTAEKAEASVNGLSLSATTINATSIGIAPTTSIATIDVDHAGAVLDAKADEVNILLSTGTLTVVNCIDGLGGFAEGPSADCTHLPHGGWNGGWSGCDVAVHERLGWSERRGRAHRE